MQGKDCTRSIGKVDDRDKDKDKTWNLGMCKSRRTKERRTLTPEKEMIHKIGEISVQLGV